MARRNILRRQLAPHYFRYFALILSLFRGPYVNLSFRNDNHIVVNPSLSNFKCSIQGQNKIKLGQVPPHVLYRKYGPGVPIHFFFLKIGTQVQAALSFPFSYFQGIFYLAKVLRGDVSPSPPVPTPMHYADIYFSIKSFDSVFLKGSCFL